jgi:DNA (cytosine-5)-methyltransferase 1
MTTYYNEIDLLCAEWLRELIKAGHIPPGDVDERDIRDVTPVDVKGYTSCHFFAGISGWPYALRLAGWPDDRPVWTGSCPCPPFSAAGKKKACPECGGCNPVPHVGRTGYFVCCLCGHEWFADERHLWPEMWRLIRDGRPPVFFGEQVASADGRVWLASVRASLEILGYAVGGADLCAAGVGAPHIRQRLWFVGHTSEFGSRAGLCDNQKAELGRAKFAYPSPTGLVADTTGGQFQESGRGPEARNGDGSDRQEYSALADADECTNLGSQPRPEFGAVPEENGGVCALADASDPGLEIGSRGSTDTGAPEKALAAVELCGPSNFWSSCEWLYCRDGKFRPTKPGLSPLAVRVPARVGRLRAAGNAISPQVAAEFIKAIAIFQKHFDDHLLRGQEAPGE